jgi:hypothetical protein
VANSPFRLRGLPLKEVAKRTWAEILNDDVFGHAAQLAYYFFLALFPFLIFVMRVSVYSELPTGDASCCFDSSPRLCRLLRSISSPRRSTRSFARAAH